MEKTKCPKCNSENTKKKGFSIRRGARQQRHECLNCHYSWLNYDRFGKEFIRVGVFSDTHCGHVTGLTHPDYNSKTDEFHSFRKESWEWFSSVVKQMGVFDYAIFNGDLIDGKQVKSGGLELLVTDRNKQVDMAIAIVKQVGALKNIIVRGTPYHTGQTENFEDNVARLVGCDIFDKLVADIGGKIFDVRHKIGRSSIPHGRVAPLSRQVLWARLKAEKTGIKADIIIRSHVHYCVSIDESGVMATTTPALQGYSQYGVQECDGETDYGFLIYDIYRDGRILVHKFLKEFDSNKQVIEYI